MSKVSEGRTKIKYKQGCAWLLGQVRTSLMDVGGIHVPLGSSVTETVNNKMERHPSFWRLCSWVRVCHAMKQLGVNLCGCKEGFVMEMLTDP